MQTAQVTAIRSTHRPKRQDIRSTVANLAGIPETICFSPDCTWTPKSTWKWQRPPTFLLELVTTNSAKETRRIFCCSTKDDRNAATLRRDIDPQIGKKTPIATLYNKRSIALHCAVLHHHYTRRRPYTYLRGDVCHPTSAHAENKQQHKGPQGESKPHMEVYHPCRGGAIKNTAIVAK